MRREQVITLSCPTNVVSLIHPIHVAAMLNKKRGLEGKFVQHYVKMDVTSLLLRVRVTEHHCSVTFCMTLYPKTRLGMQALERE